MASLAQDPAHLAYLRALGFEETTARTSAEGQRGQVEDRLAFQRPEIQYQGDIERQGVSGGYEDRGLFRSGEHERGLAQQRHGEQYRLAALDLSGAGQIADIEAGLAAQIASYRRQHAENSLSLAGDQYLTELERKPA